MSEENTKNEEVVATTESVKEHTESKQVEATDPANEQLVEEPQAANLGAAPTESKGPSPIVAQMKTYTGTKTIKAVPMTKGAYNKYRGWDMPEDENPNEQVYLVEYEADPASKPNHPDHAGYISMSPKHVFDGAYRPSETYMDRLHIEKADLDDKIAKLTAALNNRKVPESEVSILNLQLNTMQHYSKILETRIGK